MSAFSSVSYKDNIESTPNQPSQQAGIKRLGNRQVQERQLQKQAQIAAQQGDYHAAIELLDCLIGQAPTNATYYNNRGLLHFQSGRPDYAIQDYNTALKLNPKLASVYNNRANYYASQGKLIEAIADYDSALNLNPGNIRARINQGITLRDLGFHERAIEEFDLALQLSCGSAYLTDISGLSAFPGGHIYAERGHTYHLLGDWNYAIADYQRALTLLSQPQLPWMNMSHRLYLQVTNWLEELMSLVR